MGSKHDHTGTHDHGQPRAPDSNDAAVEQALQALARWGGDTWVRGLRELMSHDTAEARAVRAQIEAYAAAHTVPEQAALLQSLIQCWLASLEDLETEELEVPAKPPRSRNVKRLPRCARPVRWPGCQR